MHQAGIILALQLALLTSSISGTNSFNDWTTGEFTLPRSAYSMAVGYDESNNRTILIGGKSELNDASRQVVSFDHADETFTDLAAANSDYDLFSGQFYAQNGDHLYIARGDDSCSLVIDRVTLSTLHFDYDLISTAVELDVGFPHCLAAFSDAVQNEYLVLLDFRESGVVTGKVYSFTANSWLTNIPALAATGKDKAACIVQNGLLYVAGGVASTSVHALDVSNVLTIVSSQWEVLASNFPSPLMYHRAVVGPASAATNDVDVLFVGGAIAGDASTEANSLIYGIFHQSLGPVVWELGQSDAIATMEMAVVFASGALFSFGGVSVDGSISDEWQTSTAAPVETGVLTCGETATGSAVQYAVLPFTFTLPAAYEAVKMSTCLTANEGSGLIYMTNSDQTEFIYADFAEQCQCSDGRALLIADTAVTVNSYTSPYPITKGQEYAVTFSPEFTGVYAIKVDCGASASAITTSNVCTQTSTNSSGGSGYYGSGGYDYGSGDYYGSGGSGYYGSGGGDVVPPSLDGAIPITCDQTLSDTIAAGGQAVFTFTPTSDLPAVTLNGCASSFDTIFNVYREEAGALVFVDVNDDDLRGICGTQSFLTVQYIAGSTYALQITGFNDADGVYSVTMSCNDASAPSVPTAGGGDGCDGSPPTLDGATPITCGSTQEGTIAQDGEAMFTFIPTSDGTAVTLNGCASSFDTFFTVYREEAGALVSVATNDDDTSTCTGTQSFLTVEYDAFYEGFVYALQITGYNCAGGSYEVTMSCNDVSAPSVPTAGGSAPSVPTAGGSAPSVPTAGGSAPSVPTAGLELQCGVTELSGVPTTATTGVPTKTPTAATTEVVDPTTNGGLQMDAPVWSALIAICYGFLSFLL